MGAVQDGCVVGLLALAEALGAEEISGVGAGTSRNLGAAVSGRVHTGLVSALGETRGVRLAALTAEDHLPILAVRRALVGNEG